MKDTLNSTRVQIAAPYGGAVQSNACFGVARTGQRKQLQRSLIGLANCEAPT